MEIEKDKLMAIPYSAKFKEKYVIEKDVNLLLNDITVHGCSDSLVRKQVNFNIMVINGKRIIYPLSDYEEYYLNGKRLFKGSIVKIKATDCIEVAKHDDDYRFVLNEDVGH